MKYLLLSTLVVMLSACAGNPKQQPNLQVPGEGMAVIMDSEDYAELRKVEADAAANAEFYKAQAAKYIAITDPTAQIGIAAIDALNPNNKAPTNNNDVLIVEAEQKTARTGIRWGTADSMLGKGLIYGGVREIRKLGEAAFSSAGDETTTTTNNTASDGSTIKGAIGSGNEYTETNETEQVSGILTNPADVDPIALNSAEQEPEEVVCDLRAVLDSDPEGTDANEDGLVCSDGMGGATDN